MLTPPLARNLEASVRDLESTRPSTRVSSIADLVRHAQGDAAVRTRAIPLLEKALSSDAAAEVRSAAAVALGDLAASEALSALLVAVEDADLHVRQMALNALGEIGDVRALPRLRRALSDARPEVRYQGIIAFCRVAQEEEDALEALEKATSDEDAAVRYIALRIAEERIDTAAKHLPPPSCDGTRSERAASWMKLGPRAREMLHDPARQVRVVAAIFLAKAGDDTGHEIIERVVRGQLRADKEDEREAVEIAGELGLRDLVPQLERRAWGAQTWLGLRDTCAFHAKIALARMDHPRARAEIARDLRAAKRETRSAAVVAAGRARLVDLRETIAAMPDDAVEPELRADALQRLQRGPYSVKA
ncbi:HEAT repeat domain-containing protein [Pendulispora rubella]|uniref:HEAT repeat domain-containing protein n=1 Tax=Pendulispora rubella TaxID=2741070 RepID=A0ABZ2LH56_9BACT